MCGETRDADKRALASWTQAAPADEKEEGVEEFTNDNDVDSDNGENDWKMLMMRTWINDGDLGEPHSKKRGT